MRDEFGNAIGEASGGARVRDWGSDAYFRRLRGEPPESRPASVMSGRAHTASRASGRGSTAARATTEDEATTCVRALSASAPRTRAHASTRTFASLACSDETYDSSEDEDEDEDEEEEEEKEEEEEEEEDDDDDDDDDESSDAPPPPAKRAR